MKNRFRIGPVWWPALAALSPVLVPVLGLSVLKYYRGRTDAEQRNRERLAKAAPLELPSLRSVELSVIVEHQTSGGFLGDAGVSYLFRGDSGSMLMDVGFGPERPTFAENVKKMGIDGSKIDSLFISHLHPDHMGGLRAVRNQTVQLPDDFRLREEAAVYVPKKCKTRQGRLEIVDHPRVFPSGFASTGPLARMLCFTGITEEQAVVFRLEGKGLVVVTGCGHPTIEVILESVKRTFGGPIHMIIGGLHFPIEGSRGARLGIEFQQIIGTGKPWWSRINDEDLTKTIAALNASGAERILLSAHDTCDHSLQRLQAEIKAGTEVLKAGTVYAL